MIKIVIAKQLRPGSARFQIPISLSDVRDQFAGIKELVRKGGFEPPRLSAPPPQDGVSASSTTSARCNCDVFNNLERSASEGRIHCTGFCTDLLHSTRVSDCGRFPNRTNNFLTASSRGCT